MPGKPKKGKKGVKKAPVQDDLSDLHDDDQELNMMDQANMGGLDQL